MAFSQGQQITVTEINSTNTKTIAKYGKVANTDHAMQETNAYFYVTCPSGSGSYDVYALGGWNMFTTDEAYAYLYRLENGSWVQKKYAEDQGGNKFANREARIKGSFMGPGSYRGRARVRYCFNADVKVQNAKNNIQAGEKIIAVSNTMDMSSSTVNYASYSGFITSDLLNNRKVYT